MHKKILYDFIILYFWTDVSLIFPSGQLVRQVAEPNTLSITLAHIPAQ